MENLSFVDDCIHSWYLLDVFEATHLSKFHVNSKPNSQCPLRPQEEEDKKKREEDEKQEAAQRVKEAGRALRFGVGEGGGK